MSFGATKVPYNWRAIRDFVVASKVALQSVSQGKAGAPITGIKLFLNYSLLMLLTYQLTKVSVIDNFRNII